jgi:hypothetical protein
MSPSPHALKAIAEREAQSMVGHGERAVDVQLGNGSAKQGDDSIMVWSFSYQVFTPGATGWSSRLR